ncbi:hypothetical protein BDW02DRAFT_511219 [Decorospora gaudefroyi]|uniref:Protein kinase domain-containing protein n=1 Tax=Decorospora gaudefroyi TaxID=184978 RepID=A0A6A5K3Q0_9PLEO|nr:hypothetical protein BDW02DRAFT_511219 [Decorospora gaudefroyi]
MDPISLALGAIVLIKPVCKSIHDTWQAYRLFGHGSERLRLRFSVQMSRVDSFERVLFETGKFDPPMAGRLVDHMPAQLCRDMAGLLWELYDLVQQYAAVQDRYALQADDQTSADLVAALKDMDVNNDFSRSGQDQRVKALMELAKRDGSARQNSTDWLRKVTWALRDKRSLEKLVQEFEQYTERLKTLVEVAWWPLPFFQSASAIAHVEKDGDANETGLLKGSGIRKLLVEPSLALPGKSGKNLEIARVRFRPSGRSGPFEFGRLEGTSSPEQWYMAEDRLYGSNTNEKARERIIQLAALLNEAADTDSQFKICQCVGYFNDTAEQRIGIVSILPVDPSTSPPQMHTLSSLLATKNFRPELGTRVKLAMALMKSVRMLHLYGWVHKSLRSENVLLLPANAKSQADKGTPPANPQNMSVDLAEPRIAGFEYARPESDFSSASPQHDLSENLYRHPARWGVPRERFGKSHDMYALGVILFEIGLWERVADLDKGILLSPAMAADPEAVRQRLVKHAQRRLAFYAGSRYANFVLFCLNSGVPIGQSEDQKRQEVFLNAIEHICALTEEFAH